MQKKIEMQKEQSKQVLSKPLPPLLVAHGSHQLGVKTCSIQWVEGDNFRVSNVSCAILDDRPNSGLHLLHVTEQTISCKFPTKGEEFLDPRRLARMPFRPDRCHEVVSQNYEAWSPLPASGTWPPRIRSQPQCLRKGSGINLPL